MLVSGSGLISTTRFLRVRLLRNFRDAGQIAVHERIPCILTTSSPAKRLRTTRRIVSPCLVFVLFETTGSAITKAVEPKVRTLAQREMLLQWFWPEMLSKRRESFKAALPSFLMLLDNLRVKVLQPSHARPVTIQTIATADYFAPNRLSKPGVESQLDRD